MISLIPSVPSKHFHFYCIIKYIIKMNMEVYYLLKFGSVSFIHNQADLNPEN